jgi:cbb3-type cytochrome oxidase subunit 1
MTAINTHEDETPFGVILLYAFCGVGALLSLMATAFSHDRALIFIYIWAGPHHLHYTALPQWTQTLGMTFSIMLWMPSWGGMTNGLMTLSGAWDKLRTDPVVRMMVTSLA